MSNPLRKLFFNRRDAKKIFALILFVIFALILSAATINLCASLLCFGDFFALSTKKYRISFVRTEIIPTFVSHFRMNSPSLLKTINS